VGELLNQTGGTNEVKQEPVQEPVTNQVADEQDAPTPDEMAMLKQRARLMGITFSNNIGLDALRSKVNEKMNESKSTDENQDDDDDDNGDDDTSQEQEDEQEQEDPEKALSPMPTPTVTAPSLSATGGGINPFSGQNAGNKNGTKQSKEANLRNRIRLDAMRLVRCRITNLDPKKKDLHGEVISVGNRYIGTVKKFIPFGEQTENGYHIPKVLFDELAGREFLHIKTTRDKKTGQINVETKYVKEFSLEVLPQLTPGELADLAAQQAAANGAASS
jgi:hypothetical protein